jgi:hypothetical protein
VKHPKFIVKVNNPCSENWGEMTPADKGRHCAACQKTVIDFTIFTDREIINFFKENKGKNTCGHFLSSQLDHEIAESNLTPRFSHMVLKRVAASLLFLQTLATSGWSQAIKPKAAQHAKTPSVSEKGRILKGMVMDYLTKEQLHGVIIRISGTSIEAMTDYYGRFRMPLPDSLNLKILNLQAAYSRADMEM